MSDEKPAYEINYKGFCCRGFYGSARGNGKIEITRDDKPFKVFEYPGYRIWNIAAHFEDMIDGLLKGEGETKP